MTLQRVLEPEVMDSSAEAEAYDSMDHSDVNRKFVDDLLACGNIAGDVLDLGTGTALIPIELCRRVPDGRVIACDLSTHMLDLARYNIEVRGLTQRILLYFVDAKSLPYQDSQFDLVMSNSIVHHIPEPMNLLREAVRVCKRGGLLFIRDLLRPDDDATVKQLVNLHATDANEHQRQMFEDSLRAALRLDEIRPLVEQLGFDPAAVQATSDRHWTWVARK